MNPLKKLVLILILINLFSVYSRSQDSITGIIKNFRLSAYMDTYYSYDYTNKYSKPDTVRIFSAFAPYNNEFRLNLAYVLMKYEDEKIRANLGFRAGDMPLLLTPVEKRFIQYIKEANFGIKLGEKIWMDLGYMGNPIGVESSESAKNYLSSISLCGYFEPASLIGIKFSFELSKKLKASFLGYNSYSIASANNNNKVLAMSFEYAPMDNLSISYNSALGDEGEGKSIRKLQSYNNIYCKYNFKNIIDFIAQFDFSAQGNSKKTDSTKTAYMTSGFTALRYNVNSKFNISLRMDFINDPDGFISNSMGGSEDNLRAYSYTAGIEYKPLKNVYFRLENQYMCFNQKLYQNKDERYNILLSSGIKL
jgi:hypothetical protein